jgi:hypothetical protein
MADNFEIFGHSPRVYESARALTGHFNIVHPCYLLAEDIKMTREIGGVMCNICREK